MIVLIAIIIAGILAIYGTIDVFRQTKNYKMKELDLHGVSHYDVRDVVENFILMNNPPFRIITGSSERMRNLTQNTLDKHKFQYYTPAHNAGEIIVTD